MKLRYIAAIAATAGLFSAGSTTFAQDTGSGSESERLKKLEQAVSQLQKENAELKQQVSSQLSTPATQAAAPASNDIVNKIKLSVPVQEMDIFGEMRLRYFLNEAEVANSTISGERNRMRYRMRLGDNIKFADNLMLGVLVEANNSSHSANVTLGNSASTAADSEVFNKGTVTTGSAVTGIKTGTVVTGVNTTTGQVTTGKVVSSASTGSVVTNVNFQDAIFFAQVYMKYTPFPWLTVEGGKLPNPFTTTRMTWDPDIYPEGLAEQFRFTLGPWGGNSPIAESGKDSKDMKEIQPQQGNNGMTVDLFANFGQFVYEDVWTNNFTINSAGNLQAPHQSDIWMLGFQVGARANFDKNTFFQVAPAFYTYTGGGNIFGGKFSGDGPVIVSTATGLALVFPDDISVNDLNVLDIPAEFDWKMWNIPFRVFGDFADNLSSQARATNAGHPDKGGQGIAYQVGAGIGKIKKGGDWELLGWWQHSEQYALDPNIIDDDIFNGRLNMEGFYLQATYAFTDAFSIIVQGSRGRQIDSAIGTAGSGALGEPAGLTLKQATQFYVDLSLKF